MPPPRHRVASPPAGKPLLLWDGDCGFCRLWAERWREAYGERLDLATAQSQAERFREIPTSALAEALQLVETDGAVHSGASAALRARAHGRGRRGSLLALYDSVPGASALMEIVYRIVARNRRVFSMLMH